MSRKQRVRTLALCVFRRGDMIFVAESEDRVKEHLYYRPIGGGIEFGEPASHTIQREVQEEIQAEVADLVYLGALENIFVQEDKMGHEICLIFDGRFVDETINEDDFVAEGRDDERVLFNAVWKPLSFFREGHAPLYPDGLLALLDRET